jgi:hypothetical protein
MGLNPLFLFLFAAFAAAAAQSTVTVHAWPLSAPSPKPYATIVLSPSASDSSVKVQSISKPSVSNDELVRIGLYDSSSKAWTGVATSSKSFAPDVRQKVTLHTDSEGRVTHVGFSSFSKSKAESDDVLVDVIPMVAGPQPVLNKPVVLNAEGKLDTPGEEDSKSFLQK